MSIIIPLSMRIKLDSLPDDSMIPLYSIQHIDAFNVAKEKGYFTGSVEYSSFYDEEYGIDEKWKRAYDWMVSKMKEKNPSHSGDYPMWAYLKNPRTKQPITWTGGPYCLVFFKVPKKRILISDYESWHAPLNGACYYHEKYFDEFPPEEIMSTWDQIFDITKNEHSEWYHPPEYLQVCIDRIYMSEIDKVTTIKSKNHLVRNRIIYERE